MRDSNCWVESEMSFFTEKPAATRAMGPANFFSPPRSIDPIDPPAWPPAAAAAGLSFDEMSDWAFFIEGMSS
jgi:hypothetical protein